jgi:hypothetical protein
MINKETLEEYLQQLIQAFPYAQQTRKTNKKSLPTTARKS